MSSQQVPFYITHPQTLYCHTCGRVISSGRGTKGPTAAALDSNPDADLSTSKGRGKKAPSKSKQKKASNQAPSARQSVPKRCSERCRRAKPGAVERLVEEVFVAMLDGRLPPIRDGRSEADIDGGGGGGGCDAGNDIGAKRDFPRRNIRSHKTENDRLGSEPRTEAVSKISILDDDSSSDDNDEGGVRIQTDNNLDKDSDDDNDDDNDNSNQRTASNLPSQNSNPPKQQPKSSSIDPTWDSSLRSRAQTLIASKKLHLDGTNNNGSSSSKNKRKKGDPRIKVRCSEVLACVFPDLVGGDHREGEGDEEATKDGSMNGSGDKTTRDIIKGNDIEKQRRGMQRARTLEMVKQAARRLVVFGYPDGSDDDDDEIDVKDEEEDESGDISMLVQDQQEGETKRRRFCEALSGPTSMVVEPSFAKGDWAVRWRERRG